MKVYKLLFVLLYLSQLANAQIFVNCSSVVTNKSNLTEDITDYKTYKIDLSHVQLLDEFVLNLNLENDYNWELHLIKNNLRSNDYKSYLGTEKGLIEDVNKVRTYKGFVNQDKRNEVRLSLYEDYIEGYLKIQDTLYYILPLKRICKSTNINNVILVCKAIDLKEEILLGDDVISGIMDQVPALKSINYEDPVRMIRIAAEGDYEYYQSHSSNPNQYLEDLINLAEGVYESTFNIIFRLVHTYTYTTSSDPFTEVFSEANGSAFLAEFVQHFSTSHSGVYRDVACLFTGKNGVDVYGLAYQPGAYCAVEVNSVGYKTFAHELGHNLNGDHDDGVSCGTSNASVMCQGVKKVPLYFSSTNISAMNTQMSSRLITYSYFEDDILCGNESFSVSNVPSGFTVTWPKSTNLAFEGSSTGSSVVVKPYSYASTGDAWIEPTFSRGSSNNTVKFPKDNFSVGLVYVNPNTIEFYNSEASTGNLCANAFGNYFSFTTQSEWNSFDIKLTNLAETQTICSFTIYDTQGDLDICSVNDGTYMFWVRGTNDCGTASNWSKTSVEFEDCGGQFFLLMTPNPSSSQTTLSVGSTSTEKIDSPVEWELEVFDATQNLKEKKVKLKGSETIINTENWKEGVYLIRVNYNNEILQGKLVVKK